MSNQYFFKLNLGLIPKLLSIFYILSKYNDFIGIRLNSPWFLQHQSNNFGTAISATGRSRKLQLKKLAIRIRSSSSSSNSSRNNNNKEKKARKIRAEQRKRLTVTDRRFWRRRSNERLSPPAASTEATATWKQQRLLAGACRLLHALANWC